MSNEIPPTPPSMFRFINRDIRNKLHSKRKSLWQADFKIFSIKETKHIFINENLTNIRKKLFWMAKQRLKETDINSGHRTEIYT